MSATEGRNGSGPGTDGQDLAALRASARCGRSLPVLHLADSGEVFTQWRRQRAPIVLCCAEVPAPDPDADDPDCPGCRDCVRYCLDCVREAHRLSAGEPGDAPGHPQWCSPRHCQLTDEGERVHQGAPVRWEDCGVRFEITLVGPEDDYRTYVELTLASLIPPSQLFYAAMPVPAARRPWHQLSAHLDAAALAEGYHVAQNWVAGVAGRVMMSSDLDASGAPEDSSATETGAEVSDPAPTAPGGGPDSAS